MLFEDYVAARGPALLRLAYVLTGDGHAAQDLTSAALTDALRHWRKVDAADHLDAYVRRVLVHRHLAERRRKSSTEVVVADAGVLARTVSVDPADGVVARDEIRRVLSGLAPRARTVLVLRYYADLNDTAIADLLGISTSAVRATASRALGTLRDHAALLPTGLGETP